MGKKISIALRRKQQETTVLMFPLFQARVTVRLPINLNKVLFALLPDGLVSEREAPRVLLT
jgi:hypothetical protein